MTSRNPSLPRATPTQTTVLGSLAVIGATIFAIGAPTAQALWPFGLSAAEFASDGDQALRAASYAFSIWSVIYLGLAAYAVYQARPSAASSRVVAALRWPSAFAIAGCGAWILASAFNQKVLTVVIIALSATTITLAVIDASKPAASTADRWLVLRPLSLLAGWLTIATAINALTVLTAFGAITPSIAEIAGGIGIAAVTLIAIAVLLRSSLTTYGIPIA